MEDLITFVNTDHLAIETLKTNHETLADRLRNTFAVVTENTEAINNLPLTFMTFDELAGAQLSYNVSANAIAATTDEISQADYANGVRPPKTVTAILVAKTHTELFRSQLKIEYYNLTDISRDQQPPELPLNVLCRGGEVVFNKLLTALGTILKTVRVGHSERLLDIRRRLVTTDVSTAYDECINAILAALLMKVTASTTKTSINALTLADEKVARKKFETPLYHSIIEDFNREARNENRGYPGGAAALFKDVRTRWYTVDATHADYIRSGQHPTRANALTGEFRQNPKRPSDANRDKTPDRGGARGGAGHDPKRPTTSKNTDYRPRSPRRDAPTQDHVDYEKEMLRIAIERHAGRTNVDTEVKGTWDGVRFTPSAASGMHACVTCYVVKKKTIHHSTGRAVSTRSSSPPTTQPTVKINVPPPPAPTLEQMQKLFTPEQLKDISAALIQSTSSSSTSGGAQPQQPSINHLTDGGEHDHNDAYEEEFPAFQKTPPKMTWPVPKSTNPSVNVLFVPSAVPPSKHNRKKVQQGHYLPVPTPPGGDDFQPVSPDYSETSSEEADTNDFQKVNSKKAWRSQPAHEHPAHVLSVNNFATLSSSVDSDQPDHPPLHSDVHSDDFSQPEANTHARQRFISAEKRIQRRLLKKQRKARGPQEDLSWYVPVRPLRPPMKTRATQTIETRNNKLPKSDIFPSDENPNLNHEKTSPAATDDSLGTAVLDTMAEPIPAEDATTTYTPTSSTSGDLSSSSSVSSDDQSRHEEPADFTFPTFQNPESISPFSPRTQGFSRSEAAATLYEPSVDTETDQQPPSTSSWPNLMTGAAMDSWLRDHLALQATRHIDMNETFFDDDLYPQSYHGFGGNTAH
ncbi:hypothetical protein CYMTET_49070 [Cymbomonas tetramitiformis]|uniref:Uncharacterized protein n=1 Tax=Cymbomonas tetramitiformis TaxID=36881 RepID=A0AAE0BSW7_9CHLO|nr:hypothetical protein CYMTET_49070 [Cymbomonas tetramitiformis]